ASLPFWLWLLLSGVGFQLGMGRLMLLGGVLEFWRRYRKNKKANTGKQREVVYLEKKEITNVSRQGSDIETGDPEADSRPQSPPARRVGRQAAQEDLEASGIEKRQPSDSQSVHPPRGLSRFRKNESRETLDQPTDRERAGLPDDGCGR